MIIHTVYKYYISEYFIWKLSSMSQWPWVQAARSSLGKPSAGSTTPFFLHFTDILFFFLIQCRVVRPNDLSLDNFKFLLLALLLAAEIQMQAYLRICGHRLLIVIKYRNIQAWKHSDVLILIKILCNNISLIFSDALILINILCNNISNTFRCPNIDQNTL